LEAHRAGGSRQLGGRRGVRLGAITHMRGIRAAAIGGDLCERHQLLRVGVAAGLVLEAARQQGIDDLRKIRVGILEADGRFSFIRTDDREPAEQDKRKVE
jgi:hypothetical protein